jgi:hypothetical protein
MSLLRYSASISLDGFVAGPDQRPQHPLGVGGAILMGRNMFDGGPGGVGRLALERMVGRGAAVPQIALDLAREAAGGRATSGGQAGAPRRAPA